MVPAGRGRPSALKTSLNSNVINWTWAKSGSEQLGGLGGKVHPGRQETTAAGEDKVRCEVKGFGDKCGSSAALDSSFESEGSWVRPDSDHSSNCASSCGSASRDNWVAVALCAGCMRNSPSLVPSRPWRETFGSCSCGGKWNSRVNHSAIFINEWKLSLQTLSSHCHEPPLNSTTPFISWLAAGTGITEHWKTHPCGSEILFVSVSVLKNVCVGRQLLKSEASWTTWR